MLCGELGPDVRPGRPARTRGQKLTVVESQVDYSYSSLIFSVPCGHASDRAVVLSEWLFEVISPVSKRLLRKAEWTSANSNFVHLEWLWPC